MADGGNILREILGERMILKGGRVAIKGKVYHHDFLNEWVGKTVEITSWEYELCPGELFYRAQPLGEELFLCLSESKLPQDREEGEVLAGRDEATVEIREIIEQFQYDNPAQDRLVLDILECVGKLALPGYSVQVIASPVGTASGKEVGMADGGNEKLDTTAVDGEIAVLQIDNRKITEPLRQELVDLCARMGIQLKFGHPSEPQTDGGAWDPVTKGKMERKHRQERGMDKLSAAFSELQAMVDSHGHLNDAEFTQVLRASLNRKMESMDDVHLMALFVHAAEFSPQDSAGQPR